MNHSEHGDRFDCKFTYTYILSELHVEVTYSWEQVGGMLYAAQEFRWLTAINIGAQFVVYFTPRGISLHSAANPANEDPFDCNCTCHIYIMIYIIYYCD